jgi:hypothetical protein
LLTTEKSFVSVITATAQGGLHIGGTVQLKRIANTGVVVTIFVLLLVNNIKKYEFSSLTRSFNYAEFEQLHRGLRRRRLYRRTPRRSASATGRQAPAGRGHQAARGVVPTF